MTENEAALMMLKGTIVDLPQEDQNAIKDRAEKLRTILNEENKEHGQLAITLIGLEMAIEIGQ